MDEEVWNRIPPVEDFLQKEPVEGALPTSRTEVRFAYDDEALYVAARMFSPGGPASIQAPLGRRDSREQAEYILVSLDSFLDRRTAYSFGVTAAGVRIDHYHRSDSESDIDEGFDPVWEARTTIHDDGWTAEMWIPFSQLRFTDVPEQVWGLNLHRWVPSLNEDNYWVLIPRTLEGWASRFGELHGIRDISPSRRVELLPYATGGATLTGDRDPANPFDDGRNLKGQVGGDLKMGLGPNLTLDVTVLPDFGQVEADPAEVNLTVTETFFPERRPFFTEGGQLLRGNVVNYFYSRRIGAPPPPGRASGDFVDYPDATRILGAGKITGRLPSGTSVGVLGAVTGQEHARTFRMEEGEIRRVRVQPRAGWGVARVQQEVGSGGSTVGFLLAGVRRELEPGDPLAAFLPRDALTVAAESRWRLGGGAYELSVSGGGSHVRGEEEAMVRVQTASPRYFQRPDAPHVSVDPTLTALGGYKATLQLEKISGAHWLWTTFFDLESKGVEFNDIGRLGGGDGVQSRQSLTYRETRPGRYLRNYRVTAGQFSEWTTNRDHRWTYLTLGTSKTLDNFWVATTSSQVNLRAQEWQLTRGGPSMETPLTWFTTLRLQNSSSSSTRWGASIRVGEDESGGYLRRLEGELSLRPDPRWQITLGPSAEWEVDTRQYVASRSGGREATFGERYIFARIHRTTLALEGRVNFTLKPDMNLDLYAQPFAASGRFSDFGELLEARSRLLRSYGTDGTGIRLEEDGSRTVTDGPAEFTVPNRDFNLRSFRSTSVLRWEWRPGSTLYLVWQQDRARREAVGDRVRLEDMLGSFRATGDNFFAVKASYWLGL